MDHTPVYFLMHPKNTLDIKEKKTMHVWSSTDDTKGATVAVTITELGDKLPFTGIFKGTENGCNA